MEKIKYRVIEDGDAEYTIVVEDGGVATLHHNGHHMLTTYYQDRITEETSKDEIWDELAEGKAYIKDWEGITEAPTKKELEEMVMDAVDWLVYHPDYGFEFVRDDSIWPNILTTP